MLDNRRTRTDKTRMGLNAMINGWHQAYRHADNAQEALSLLDEIVWNEVRDWLHRKHPQYTTRQICQRYLITGDSGISTWGEYWKATSRRTGKAVGKTRTLNKISRGKMPERYPFRGYKIPTGFEPVTKEDQALRDYERAKAADDVSPNALRRLEQGALHMLTLMQHK